MNEAHLVIISSLAMLVAGFVTFVSTYFLTAPYGRFSTSKGWGPLIEARTAWFLMESPNLWTTFILWMIYRPNQIPNLPTFLLLLCFLVHYFNRSILFPLKMKPGTSNSMPLSVMGLALFYCTWNGSTQSLYLIAVSRYPDSWIYEPRFLLGIALFWIGMYINIQSDATLFSLRKNSTAGGAKEYKIPRGGAFELVSVANYFGEILEWTGFAVASWSLPALAFAVFTAANLIPRAVKYHKWYLEKFEDYPKNRKAVIPFLW